MASSSQANDSLVVDSVRRIIGGFNFREPFQADGVDLCIRCLKVVHLTSTPSRYRRMPSRVTSCPSGESWPPLQLDRLVIHGLMKGNRDFLLIPEVFQRLRARRKRNAQVDGTAIGKDRRTPPTGDLGRQMRVTRADKDRPGVFNYVGSDPGADLKGRERPSHVNPLAIRPKADGSTEDKHP
jgi:hypothetical protein